MPFYKAVNEKIREVDNDTILFYEPAVHDIFGGGFKENVGGPDYRDREVLSYHVYCGMVNTQGEPKYTWLCDLLDKKFSDAKKENVKSLQIGGFLTEFGALGNSESSAQEIERVLSNVDTVFHSWTYWQFKGYKDITTAASPYVESFYQENGDLQTTKVKTLSRPYAYAICGMPQTYNFNRKTSRLQYILLADECDNGNARTEFYLNNQFYY